MGDEQMVVRRGAGTGARVLVVVALLAGAVALWATRDPQVADDQAAPPTTTPTTGDDARPPATVDPNPAPAADAVGPDPVPGGGQVARLEGAVPSWVTGSLVLAGPGDTTIWVVPLDDRPVRRIDGPDEAAAVGDRARNPMGPTVVGETVVWADGAGVTALSVGAQASGIGFAIPLGSASVPVVGSVPGPGGRSVWVHTRPDDADVFWRIDVPSLTPRARVVLGDGETVRPAGLELVGATDHGPVVRWPGESSGAGLWSLDEDGGPHTRLGEDRPVIATGTGAVVVEQVPATAEEPAVLAILDPVDATSRTIPPGSGITRPVDGGAVSPDGTRLALIGSGSLKANGELVVIGLGDELALEARHALASTVLDVVWDPTGDTAAVLDADHPQRWRLLAYRAADADLERLPVAVDRVPMPRSRAPALVGFSSG
ncbi:MAG TPA: hypothetical protein VK866_00520 [Acidimicrobiales bacterium]|nr:hypothetical protein [Acidimicrobiales bacterium]